MALPGYVFAIGAAGIGTVFSILRKNALLKTHALNFESARTLSIVLLSLVLIPFINLNISWKVVLLVYGVSILGTTGILFASKALRHDAISLIAPLSNIRPGFVALLAFFFLGETIGAKEITGILIMLAAAYLLESDHHFSDFISPVRHLMKDKYSLFFIFAVFLFAINSVLNKYIITYHLDIFTYFFLTWIFIAFNFNLVHTLKYGVKDTINCFKEITYVPLLVGGLSMTMNLLALKALSLAFVSLVSPVLMLSTLFTVLIGGRFFHEQYLLFRLGAAVIMMIGAYLIII